MSSNERDDQTHPVDILYVITKSNWGGAQKYVYDVAIAAHETLSVAIALGGHGALAEKLEAAGIPVHEVNAFQRDISLGKEFRSFLELFRLFRKLRPAIVHLNSSKAGGLGALAAQVAGVPHVVYTSHGLPFEEDRPWWQKRLITFFTWLTFVLCDQVIIITQANFEVAKKMLWLGRRLELIRIGIAPVKSAARRTARDHLIALCDMPPPSSRALWIGTIAEYHPNKGLLYLIQAIDMLRGEHPEILCVLIGDGELREILQEEIEIRGLTKNVFLAGFVEDAARYLSAFDIVTLTSLKEGLPYVILEAGSTGIPIVGSGIPGIQEVVTDMTSGVLVRPKQPKEIAGALTLLLDDKERRMTYGKALKERVERDFSAARMLEHTLALYTQLLFDIRAKRH